LDYLDAIPIQTVSEIIVSEVLTMFIKSERIPTGVMVVLYFLSLLAGLVMFITGLMLVYIWIRHVPGFSVVSVSTALAFALSLILLNTSISIGKKILLYEQSK